MTTSADWLAQFPTLEQLDAEPRAWAVNWLRHAAGEWGGSPGNLGHDLARCRKHRPQAFAWLVLNSTRAAGLAASRGWSDTRRSAPTDEELAAVAAAVASVVPQEPARTPGEQIDALTGLPARAYHLTPEQLDVVNPLPNGRKRSGGT